MERVHPSAEQVSAAVEADPSPILLYDGACGLCDRAIQFVLARERRNDLRFAALQGETAGEILARHGLEPPEGKGFDTMVFVEDPGTSRERTHLRSRAALKIGRYLGGRYASLARLGHLFPNIVRDAVYRVIAKNRHRLFPAPDACRVPTPEVRKRFLP